MGSALLLGSTSLFNFAMLETTGLFTRNWESDMLTGDCRNSCFFSTETSEF